MTAATEACITVEAQGARQRLDRYLAERGEWGSRAQVQRLISDGHVRLDGQVVKPATVLRAGQRIEVHLVPQTVTEGYKPEPIPLAVLHEDDWLLVIDKPPGLVVHPAPGHWGGTLVNALLHHWRGTRPGLDPARPGIVHRLDKDTSGVLVIAKDGATLADLGHQFRRREVEKQYLAFVWGRLRDATGTITAPIARHPVARQRMAVRRGGRDALTTFEVIERYPHVTLLRLFPKTGRTHQIRVHLATIGHPIIGDAVYGRGRARAVQVPAMRQALHAEQITFRHPHSGVRVRYRAPLAADLQILRRACSNAA